MHRDHNSMEIRIKLVIHQLSTAYFLLRNSSRLDSQASFYPFPR